MEPKFVYKYQRATSLVHYKAPNIHLSNTSLINICTFLSNKRQLKALRDMTTVKSNQRPAATILAVGTATPPNCFYQADYPDFYFRATNSEHKTELKEKFKRICKHGFTQINLQ